MSRVTPQRAKLERPFESAHDASIYRRSSRPLSFRARLTRFITDYRAEIPTEQHAAGVWVGRQEITKDGPRWSKELVGGSQLGSPADRPEFVAYLSGSAFRTEHASSDGSAETTESYATPVQATITWLERNRHPLIAAALRFIGRNASYEGLKVTCGTCTSAVALPDEYCEAIARDAERLYERHKTAEPIAKAVA